MPRPARRKHTASFPIQSDFPVPLSQIPLSGYGGVSDLTLDGLQKNPLGDFWTNVGHPETGKIIRLVVTLRNIGSRAAFVKALAFKGLFPTWVTRPCCAFVRSRALDK